MRKFLTVLACVGMFFTTVFAEGELKTEVEPQVFHNTNIYKSNIHQKSDLTTKELDYILENTSLEGYGYAFKKMEEKYNANALFAISIASIEGGIQSKRVDNKNNYFGFMAGGVKIRYNTIEDNIMAFGQMMNKPYYVNKDFVRFSKTYCPPNHKIWRDAVYSKYYHYTTKLNEYIKNNPVSEEPTTVEIIPLDYSEIMINLKLESSELAWGEQWRSL